MRAATPGLPPCLGAGGRGVGFWPGARATWFPVPAYLPELAKEQVRWTRRHVLRVSVRYGVDLGDLWDESITALLRAALHYTPALGRFNSYAQTCVHRACWRYVVGPARCAGRRPPRSSHRTPVQVSFAESDLLA